MTKAFLNVDAYRAVIRTHTKNLCPERMWNTHNVYTGNGLPQGLELKRQSTVIVLVSRFEIPGPRRICY
jgi:hypothetical protein